MRVMQIINFESDEGDIDESDVGNEQWKVTQEIKI